MLFKGRAVLYTVIFVKILQVDDNSARRRRRMPGAEAKSRLIKIITAIVCGNIANCLSDYDEGAAEQAEAEAEEI
jgi:hypothetical protein